MTKNRRLIVLFLIVSPISMGPLALAADHYVAPNGLASGDGSLGKPWDLVTALNQPASVQSGDTIWLRGGTYSGSFTSRLTGAAGNPIIVRQYPGERATLDGGAGTAKVLTVDGAWTWYWGFEMMSSAPSRSGDANTPQRSFDVDIFAHDVKFINTVVHDLAQGFGFWSAANNTDSELYGNLIYNNGWDGPDRGHGHSIYVQNQFGTKHITDNILFNSFSFGVHAYTQGSYVDNLDIEGNTSFNHGVLSHVSGATGNILIGPHPGVQNAQNPVLKENYTYYPYGDSGRGIDIKYNGATNPTIQNNYLASDTALNLNASGTILLSANLFAGAVSFASSTYPNNTYVSGRPTGVEIFVRPNKFETGRANITIYNWDKQPSVSVSLSGVGLAPGDAYEIRNAQNYWATPFKGTYSGLPVTIPMTGWTAAAPVGWTAPASTFPEFGVFVLQRANAATNPPPPSPCDVNGDGSTNVVDVQLEINQALGIAVCTADINKDGACNVIDVQRVIDAALGGACVSP